MTNIKIKSYKDLMTLSRDKVLQWNKKNNHWELKNNINNNDVKQLIKGLRYIRNDFGNYNLRKNIHGNTTNKVEKTIIEFFELNNRPNVKVITPRKQNKKTVAGLAQQYGKNWTKFFVPTPTSGKSQIIYKKRKNGERYALIKTNTATYDRVDLIPLNLIEDSQKEINRAMQPVGNDYAYLKLEAGMHMIGGEYGDLEAVNNDVQKLMERYSDKEAGNYFGNWMHGISIVKEFTKQKKNNKRKSKKK